MSKAHQSLARRIEAVSRAAFATQNSAEEDRLLEERRVLFARQGVTVTKRPTWLALKLPREAA